MSDRIIIGENFLSGLPVSAPLRQAGFPLPVRWVKHATHFALECWFNEKWHEVPCLAPKVGGEGGDVG